jgi:hypothetical protein
MDLAIGIFRRIACSVTAVLSMLLCGALDPLAGKLGIRYGIRFPLAIYYFYFLGGSSLLIPLGLRGIAELNL